MNKKYTVFLSSTYDDLREERRAVIQALLEIDCIPCSMETFPADNDEQFEFIKSIIDECDYYILIIAGRYGSVGGNGKSFTEMEYRYAVQKEIPIMTFIHSNIDSISLSKSEVSEKNREKLNKFIEYVSKDKLVKYWNGKEDLAGKVSRTMAATIKRHHARGWVREDFCINNIQTIFAGEKIDSYLNNTYLLDEMFKIAISYKEQNEFEKSRLFFECCLILFPENEDVLREYGGLYYDNQQYKKALYLWEKLLKVQKSSRNYYLCAIAYKNLGNNLKAKELGILALKYPEEEWHNMIKNIL